MDLENTSHLEVHKKAFCFTAPNEGLYIKKANTEEEAKDMLSEDFDKGYLSDVAFRSAAITGLDEFTKVLGSIKPYPALDIVYFEGILTTRVGASVTLKQREDELES